MSYVEWKNLRSWNGSQHSAFEELCCQLANYEDVPPGSEFIRKGTPDAGVECYWQLPNGDERAWQAKLFTSIPGPTQWRQVDESVKTALEKHNRLTSYTICMPLDRTDPRYERNESFMDKWDAHKEKWKQWAAEKGRAVEFNYWGSYEIHKRLSREEHRGRYSFWFKQELFSHRWFEERVNETISNAGTRYTPEINVGLPIVQIFEGLGRTQDFFKQLKRLYGKIKKSYSDMDVKRVEELDTKRCNKLKKRIDLFTAAMATLIKAEKDFFEFNEISKLSHAVGDTAWDLWDCVGITVDQKKEKKSKDIE